MFIACEYIRGYYLHLVKFSYFLVSIVKYFYKTTACLKNRAYARSCSLDHFFIWGHSFRVRAQNFRKTNISYPLIRTHTCAIRG